MERLVRLEVNFNKDWIFCSAGMSLEAIVRSLPELDLWLAEAERLKDFRQPSEDRTRLKHALARIHPFSASTEDKEGRSPRRSAFFVYAAYAYAQAPA
ncbi:hypothetical protein ACLBWT_09660 [Paenibacillus sp. D51F]